MEAVTAAAINVSTGSQPDSEAVVLGGIADSVHEVIEFESAAIDQPPRIAMRWRKENDP